MNRATIPILFLALVLATLGPPSVHAAQRSCAYVTMITGNQPHFIQGAITLGQSLQNTMTQNDMVLIHHDLTDQHHINRLERVGWRLKHVEAPIVIPKDKGTYKRRLKGVFNKLTIFNLVEYRQVVYLDADTLLMNNIDELCDVNAEFGAVMRGTLFNSGVLVVKPSQTTYNKLVDLVDKIPTTYPGGDQGFLNSVYFDFNECPYVDPQGKEYRQETEAKPFQCARLPARYNADVGIYALNKNTWPYNPQLQGAEHPKVLHFTLVDMKPWDWWSYLLTPIHWKWWRIYISTLKSISHISMNEAISAASMVLAIFGIVFLSKSHRAQQGIMTLYSKICWRPLRLAVFCVLQAIAILASWKLSLTYVFHPLANYLMFSLTILAFLDLLLFEHTTGTVGAAGTPFARYAIRICMLVSHMAIGTYLLVLCDESLSLFPRIAIHAVSWGTFHVAILPYYFAVYVGEIPSSSCIPFSFGSEHPFLSLSQVLESNPKSEYESV